MFKQLQLSKDDKAIRAGIVTCEKDQLPEGNVLVKVDYSTLNYKDGLAITGSAPIIRAFPGVPGIDLAGVIEESDHPCWQAGDQVLLNGYGIGEATWGGLSQYARVNGDHLVKVPEGYSTRDTMALGTAGYTAALCVDALVKHGLEPGAKVLVTGATGGVGSVAIALLKAAGFSPVAATGKPEAREYLEKLGADDVIDRATLAEPGKPMQAETWAAVVDAAGGNTLVNAIAQTRYDGAIAACGLADSMSLPATMAPFILRNVTLYGIDSVMAPMEKRIKAWARLARDFDLSLLEPMITEIALAEVPETAAKFMAGTVTGRYVVDVNA